MPPSIITTSTKTKKAKTPRSSSSSTNQPPTPASPLNAYRTLKILGEGSFGKVYLATHTSTQRYVCIKAIDIKDSSSLSLSSSLSSHAEVTTMQKLTHPNIVQYLDSFQASPAHLFIVMQYYEGGDMASKIKAAKNTHTPSSLPSFFPEAQLWQWFTQLCLGLEFMHAQQIIHRDIKPNNIFIHRDTRLVLGDVGVARTLEGSKDLASTAIGTPYFMSPELFQNKGHNTKTDIWSLGAVFYEMCYLQQAFSGGSISDIGAKVLSGRFRPINEEERGRYSSQVGDLLVEMMNVSAERRPAVKEILRGRKVLRRYAAEYGRWMLLLEEDDGREKGKSDGEHGGGGGAGGEGMDAVQREALQRQMETYGFLSSSSSSLYLKGGNASTHTHTHTAITMAAPQQAPQIDQEAALQEVLAKLRQERTARLQEGMLTISISNHMGPGEGEEETKRNEEEEEEEEREEPQRHQQQQREQRSAAVVRFSETRQVSKDEESISPENRNGGKNNHTHTQTHRHTTTERRFHESRTFLVRVLGEELFNAAWKRKREKVDVSVLLKKNDKGKYVDLFLQLVVMEGPVSVGV